MKSKKMKILIMILLIIIIMIPSNIFAETTVHTGIDTDITIGQTNAINSSVGTTERVVGVLQVAGTLIAIMALIIIGMRYMFSSLETRAQMKGVLGYYIIGAILVLCTSNVLGFAYSVIDDTRHAWEHIEHLDAKCEETGYDKYRCQICNSIRTDIIPETGHDFSGEEASSGYLCKEATCYTKATYYKRCINGECTEKGTETFESGSVLEHVFDRDDQSDVYLCELADCEHRNIILL